MRHGGHPGSISARLRRAHQLGGQPSLPVRSEHRERRDVTVHLRRVLLHFREDITYHFTLVIFRDLEQLGPAQDMIEVVLEVVVLR